MELVLVVDLLLVYIASGFLIIFFATDSTVTLNNMAMDCERHTTDTA